MSTPPHGTVTFLFTDVEGSTRLWERAPEAMRAALGIHDGILRSAIEEREGYVFSTAGDAFSAAFWTARDALEAAAEAQRRLAAEAWPGSIVLRVRMGMHTGTAEERGGDYFGPTVNRAARLMSAGHGGQILLSEATASLLSEEQLVDLGEHRLRDLSTTEHIYQLGAARHPALRTLDAVQHNLPSERTELFGRETDVARVADALLVDRLVTLTGMGGAGKTRLAVAAASTIVEAFRDGVWFIDLVPVAEPARLPHVIAETIGLRLEGDDPAQKLVDSLRSRRLLVLLDNCEHIVEAVAEIVDMWMERAPNVTVLATSREPLEVVGEHVIVVPPLPVGYASSPAHDLFIARAVNAGASVEPDDLATIRSVCQRLDGLPLAIELAAAQTVQLSPGELLERLDARFELLVTPGRGRGRRRQSSLAGVLDNTWSLLSPEERELLTLLAVFPSDFDLDAVEGLGRGALPSPATTLRRLVSRALVSASHGAGKSQYRLLETVKLYGRSKWKDEGRAQRDRHLNWLADRMRSLPIEQSLTSLQFAAWYQSVMEDVRAAVRHATDTGQFELAARIVAAGGYGWRVIGGAGAQDALVLIDEFLAHGDIETNTVAHLHLTASFAALGARRLDRMRDEAELARSAAHECQATAVEVMALIAQSWSIAPGDPSGGLSILDRATRLADDGGLDLLHDAAAANRITFLILAHHIDEALEIAVPLTFSRRQRDYATINAAMGVYSAMLLTDPELANRALDVHIETIESSGFPLDWTTALHQALIAATLGRTGRCREQLDEAIARSRRAGLDDLPDLLLAPALAAFQLGELHRTAHWLFAIREAKRPTQGFPSTIIYRQLRDRVASAPAPRGSVDLAAALAEARRWLMETEHRIPQASAAHD